MGAKPVGVWQGLLGVSEACNSPLRGGYLPAVVGGHFRARPSSRVLHLHKGCLIRCQGLGGTDPEGVTGETALDSGCLRPFLDD